MFGDADHFMDMVREHYAPVYRHRSVEFGAFSESGDEASLEATLVDNDNVVWTALYSLTAEANGRLAHFRLRPREIGRERNLILRGGQRRNARLRQVRLGFPPYWIHTCSKKACGARWPP